MNGNPNVTPYLKKGQLVFVTGSQSLRVYSSKKDRCMKAGLTINVRQVELLGTKNDDIPGTLYSPADNAAHEITKHYYCADMANKAPQGAPIELISRSNETYLVDNAGWVSKKQEQADTEG